LPIFLQLARGVRALHQAGMLHRDLKPSNVLVVGHQAVVLDFGLVCELGPKATTLTEDGSISGTPAYMAPEQLSGEELGEASDWYAFGVMLYEAVSGLLPIDGPLMELMRQKVDSDPDPLHQLMPEIPAWLDELCIGLLRRVPAERLRGEDVLSLLERNGPEALGPVPDTATENTQRTETELLVRPTPLVGRSTQLAELWNALSCTEEGNTVVLHVRGASGTGKSALVEQFLSEIEAQASGPGRSDALVLRSRCYELEAMPFKALDGVMDALVRHLAHRDDLEVAHLLPAEITALAQLFPVLERLNAVKRLLSAAKPIRDALQNRKRAEEALRGLLYNVAARTPVVLWIDDLQWGDLDSARILKGWLGQPGQAPILFVFTYRSDEVSTSACLDHLLRVDRDSQQARVIERSVDIVALESTDIQALCEQRLRPETPARAEVIDLIVREAQGSPFLATQLTALAEAKLARGETDLRTLSIDLLVAQAGALLAPEAKELLAVLAVAGRPIAPKAALEAANLRHGGRALVHELRALNLVRTRDVGGQRKLEVYHDRVRETVQAGLTAERRRHIHESLLATLEFSGHTEPDWLHTLALGAGKHAAALQYGTVAAERASASLAFERAAGLYQQCIALVPAGEGSALWTQLGLALARGGHGARAAEAYVEAAKHAPADQIVPLTQLAASHFLRSGRFSEGDALVRRVLDAMQIAIPSSDAGVMAAIVWERLQIKLRGTNFTPRPDRNYPAGLLRQFDVLSAMYLETQAVDPVRAALFEVRGLRCALDAGEPKRIVRALCNAASMAALSGSSRAARESSVLLARAASLATELSERDYGAVCAARAYCYYLLGRNRDALAPAYEAERVFRTASQDDPHGDYYRRMGCSSIRIGVLRQLGEYRPFLAELRNVRDEAHATDNRAALLQLSLTQTLAEQIEGQGAISRLRLDEQRHELPAGAFGILHGLHMVATMNCACWTGDYAWATEHLEATWQRYLRSAMHRTACLAALAHAQRACFLLNRHVAERRSGDPRDLVRQDLRQLEKLSLPECRAAVSRIRARLEFLLDQRQSAAQHLRESARVHQEIEMPHEAARDGYALGALLGGAEGDSMRSAAEQSLRDLGMIDPIADARAHYPEIVEARPV
jgi:hypothetical protein